MVGSYPTYQYSPSLEAMIKLMGSEAAVRREYKKLRDITHKRIVRLKKSNMLDSSVLRRYETGIPEAKNMSSAEIVREMSVMVRLLDYRATSTVTGIKEIKKKQESSLKQAVNSLKKFAKKLKEERKKAAETKKAEKAKGKEEPADAEQPAGQADLTPTGEPIEVLDEYVNTFNEYGPSYGEAEETEDEYEDYYEEAEEEDFDTIVEFTQDIIDLANSMHMEGELYKKYGGGKSGFDEMADEVFRSGLYKTGDPSVGLTHFINEIESDFRKSRSMY